MCKKQLADLAIEVKFSVLRRSQGNPSERFMKETGKYVKIHCFKNYRKWPQLLPKVEECLNHTMTNFNDFSSVELMFNETRPDHFKKFLNKEADQLPPDERLSDKVLRAYLRMKLKADKEISAGKEANMSGSHKWVAWFSPGAKLFLKPQGE